MRPRAALLFAALAFVPRPAPAQEGSALLARTHAFTRALESGAGDSLRSFFPRRGGWTWVRTEHGPGLPTTVSRWRFGAEETLRAITHGAPVCESLTLGNGHYGPIGGTLGDALSEGGEPLDVRRAWRHAGGHRVEPRARRAWPYTYLQWRREDGRWVIATLADEIHGTAPGPRVLGSSPFPVARREVPRNRAGAFAPSEGFAAREEWYRRMFPILLEDRRYFIGVPPHPAPDSLLARIGSVGKVGVYVEAGTIGVPDYLLVPVRPGEYQPYQFEGPSRCYDS